MNQPISNSVNAGLERQALKRPISDAESRLAAVMEQIFRSGVTEFAQVATLLQQNGVQPPSGASGPWSPELLLSELVAINRALDRAYESGGRE